MIKTRLLGALGALVCIGIPSMARADFTFNFDVVVTGDTPGGDTPWATLTCQDTGSDEVTFTLTQTGTAPDGQFLDRLLLNFDDELPGDFAFDTDDDASVTGATWGTDSFNDAGSAYDIQVQFSNSNSDGSRIEAGESVSWTFTGSGVECEDFHVLSVPQGDNEAFLALLHINGVGPENEGSSKVGAVPEPASMSVLALGALGVLARRRRKSA